MRENNLKSIVFIFLVVFVSGFFSCSVYAENDSNVDWNKPETIDPLDENIGDFLDGDLQLYRQEADNAYRSGDYEKAARYYLLVARYNSSDAVAIYNLACCYGLLGEAKLAGKYIERAVKAGYENISYIKTDPDFNNVRGQEPFDGAIKNAAKNIEAKIAALGQTIFINGTALFEGRIKLPENYDPNKAYPLLIGLHGLGSDADEFITLWNSFTKPEFIYVALQGHYPVLGENRIGYSWSLRIAQEEGMTNDDIFIAVEYIAQTASGIAKNYKISDTFVMGFSQGATFTYLAGINYPELFEGIFCFGGRFPADLLSEQAVKNASDKLRIFISHGKNEPGNSFTQAITSREALKSYGYDVKFSPHDGAHVPPPPIVMYEFQRWMKEK
ncbi:MAG: hypothetical protein GY839_03265 [candidate division Zixibacteria bacterium]|nr:hypothetical protein [candidate division Zixibacteria bacterium]